jgi:hypothetical protein
MLLLGAIASRDGQIDRVNMRSSESRCQSLCCCFFDPEKGPSQDAQLCEPHQRHSVDEPPAMPDGLRSVFVVAARAGGTSPFVTVNVRADATLPGETPLAISAA